MVSLAFPAVAGEKLNVKKVRTGHNFVSESLDETKPLRSKSSTKVERRTSGGDVVDRLTRTTPQESYFTATYRDSYMEEWEEDVSKTRDESYIEQVWVYPCPGAGYWADEVRTRTVEYTERDKFSRNLPDETSTERVTRAAVPLVEVVDTKRVASSAGIAAQISGGSSAGDRGLVSSEFTGVGSGGVVSARAGLGKVLSGAERVGKSGGGKGFSFEGQWTGGTDGTVAINAVDKGFSLTSGRKTYSDCSASGGGRFRCGKGNNVDVDLQISGAGDSLTGKIGGDERVSLSR
ncbi:MAG: hypothetical protein FJZ00_12320 [Candidatus Sericytochromatia bacterium]|uniref:Uncharacterized protein n=1 Tax=Candidatus Tanganyikabacteria bacterium TaxID=2961651 RepID=A0A938BM37_9BACT|nr:hypothetical protein [Candidatus Tanganyikabacteria bacterium]